ncbi:MAG TPA: hypothetical protein VGG46_03960 [Terriglobales bacterium]|jgi:hypothetical protein
MNVGVLNSSQPIGAKPSQFTDRDGAEFLVQRMVAERISRKVIRFLPLDSTFRQFRPLNPQARYIPERLTSGEIPGVKYISTSYKNRRNVVVLRALTRIWWRETCAQKAN